MRSLSGRLRRKLSEREKVNLKPWNTLAGDALKGDQAPLPDRRFPFCGATSSAPCSRTLQKRLIAD